MLESILKFARLRIIATCFALAFLGSVSGGAITLKTFFTLLIIAAWTVHANSINDFSDRDIDKVNLKNAADRPLVTKDISYKKLWIIHFGSGFLTLFFSYFYGISAVIFTLLVLLIDYIYSLKPIRVTNRTIASPLLLSFAYVYYSFSLGYWSTSFTLGYPWFFTTGLYFGFIARLLLKDFRDVKGDKQFGKVTFLLRYGTKTTCIISSMFWFLAALVVIKATSFAPGVIVPLILGLIMTFILLYKLSKAPKVNDQQNLIAFIAKIANFTIITILAYLLCKRALGLSITEIQLIPATTGVILLMFNWLKYLSIKKTRYVRSAQ